MDEDFNEFVKNSYSFNSFNSIANITIISLNNFIRLCDKLKIANKLKILKCMNYDEWFINTISMLILNDSNNFDQAYSRIKLIFETIKKVEGEYNNE